MYFEYAQEKDTKYHIGDKVYSKVVIGVVVKAEIENDTAPLYALTFLNPNDNREIWIPMKTAWWTEEELDDFNTFIECIEIELEEFESEM